jgi:hypothetical protein
MKISLIHTNGKKECSAKVISVLFDLCFTLEIVRSSRQHTKNFTHVNPSIPEPPPLQYTARSKYKTEAMQRN